MRKLVTLLSLSALAGCATMMDGNSQMVTITTSPPGAACIVDQLGAPAGEHLEQIEYTPGAVILSRANKPLKITCALQGYPTAQVIQPYGVNPTASMNVFNGVIIGTLVDNASGSLYRYPHDVHVDLVPHPVTVPAGTPVRLSSTTVPPRAAVTPTALAPLKPAH